MTDQFPSWCNNHLWLLCGRQRGDNGHVLTPEFGDRFYCSITINVAASNEGKERQVAVGTSDPLKHRFSLSFNWTSVDLAAKEGSEGSISLRQDR